MMSGLRSDYLSELSKYCLQNFIEVIPYDYFKTFELKDYSQFILNLSNSASKGSHYIAISIKKDYSIYFDSFGVSCRNSEILTHLEQRDKPIIHSKIQIQDFFSMFCGYFCLAFLIYDQNEHSIKNFINTFSKRRLLENDQKCVKIITSHIRRLKTTSSNV